MVNEVGVLGGKQGERNFLTAVEEGWFRSWYPSPSVLGSG